MIEGPISRPLDRIEPSPRRSSVSKNEKIGQLLFKLKSKRSFSFTLENAIERKNNNFDVIRLVAALAVVFGHSFDLFKTYGHLEPLKRVLIVDYSGSLAVYIFFFLSGIFITASFNRSENLSRFLVMRAYRIYPALIVCLVLTVFLLGTVFTTIPISDYFGKATTWRYLFQNMVMLKFYPVLDSVFRDNLRNDALNGSLWTLSIEIKCYLLVFLFGVLGLLKRRFTVVSIFIAFVILTKLNYLESLLQVAAAKPLLFFFGGAMSFSFRKYFILNYKVGLLLIAVCFGSYFVNFKLFIGLFYVALIYNMLVVATSDLIKMIKLPGDYSYGIYIYGFLIQQTIAHLAPDISSYQSLILSLPITYLFGMLSWHFVESPALKLGSGLFKIKLSREQGAIIAR
jgi:peptidoglycan/LPS O-acetylase OafA/YrhL